MSEGPFFVWLAGFVGLFGMLALIELAVVFVVKGGHVASGEDPS